MARRIRETTGTADAPVRLRRAPACDPPFDDERLPGMSVPAMSAQPFLYLPPATPGDAPLRLTDHGGDSDPAAGHDDRAANHGDRVASHGDRVASHGDGTSTGEDSSGAEASAAGDSADSANAATSAAVTRFLRTCLEIFNGRRPVAHLASLTDAAQIDARQALTETARLMQQVVRATGRGTVVRLRRTRACRPKPGVAEITAVLSIEHPTRTVRYPTQPADRQPEGQRPAGTGTVRAMACRLEEHNGRWLCTVARLL